MATPKMNHLGLSGFLCMCRNSECVCVREREGGGGGGGGGGGEKSMPNWTVYLE